MERKIIKPQGSRLQIWLLCMAMLPAVVQAQFIFTTNNGAITITGYTGSGGTAVIPDATNGYPVTSIGDEAFYGCDGLTNVTIPASVTGLGHGAFAFCGSLTSVAIPDSVTNLGEYAFYSCGSLASATISTNVTSIAISAFDSCTGLTNVTIPNGVTNIGSSAFQNCASLGGVFIPTSVTNIGLYAFDSCGGLTAITVDPQNMNYSSADGVLFNPGQSTLIQCPGGKAGCYVISNTVTNIGNIAFDSCAGLTSVVIPFSVKSIGDWAFDSCTGLTILKIPNSATNIGCSAFDSCSGLTSISIQPFPAVDNSYSGGAAVIRDHTFEACTSLMSVTIGPWVTTIMSYAFDGCTNVTGFYFQYNAPLLYYTSVFSNDINATVYYEPWRTGWDSTFGGLPTAQWLNPNGFTFTTNNGAITITGYTASGYDDLIIPDTTNGLPVTSIGEQAFYRCEGLTSITIPNTVTSIGSAAFYSCTRLTSVYCLGNSPVPTDDSSVFLYDSSPTVYYLPGTTGWGATFDGVPTASWMLPNPTILNFEPNFGIQTNQFGFTVSWATNIPVVVEACTDLANPVWFPVGTNMLTGGSSYFTDSQWTNYPSRFYRLRSP
jgi:hypothetical protein